MEAVPINMSTSREPREPRAMQVDDARRVVERRRERRDANAGLGEQAGRAQEEVLSSHHAMYRVLIDNSLDMLSIHEADGTIRYVSPSIERILGYKPAERLGKCALDLIHPEDMAAVVETYRNSALTPELTVTAEYRYRHKDGSWRWLESAARNLLIDPVVNGVVISTRDITDRKQAEEELRRHSKRLELLHRIGETILRGRPPTEIGDATLRYLRELVPCQHGSVFTLDQASRDLVVLSVDSAGTTRLSPGQRIPFCSLAEDGRIIDRMRQGEPYVIQDTLILPATSTLARLLHDEGQRSAVNVPLIADGELFGVLSLGATEPCRFSSEQVQTVREIGDEIGVAVKYAEMFERVSAGRDRMQLLSRQLVSAQEAERREIARELHDQIGQNLTTLSATLSIASSQLPPDAAGRLARRFADAQHLLEETVGRVRHLMSELRPPVLDDYGLASALRWYGDLFAARTGVSVLVAGTDSFPRLPAATEIALFRIIQEALANVAQHSQAAQAAITLEAAASEACVTIVDHGKGFDPTLHHGVGVRPEWGIIHMRERAEAVNGTLRIETAPGHGTRIVVTVPR